MQAILFLHTKKYFMLPKRTKNKDGYKVE